MRAVSVAALLCFMALSAPAQVIEHLSATLLTVTPGQLILQTKDHRVIEVRRLPGARFQVAAERGRPRPIAAEQLHSGDTLELNAYRAAQGRYVAEMVQLTRRGSPDDRVAAEQALDHFFRDDPPSPSAPPPAASDPDIADARTAALQFTESLPNFTVRQITTRYRRGRTEIAKGRKIDVVTADLLTRNGVESLQNASINGGPSDPEKIPGFWSTGQYATMVRAVMDPAAATVFTAKGPAVIDGQPARRYAFTVAAANSRLKLQQGGQSYWTAFGGNIWFEKETASILRVEIVSRDLPRAFPMSKMESRVQFGQVPLGDGTYLLPVTAETVACQRNLPFCERNEIQFRGYKKFGAQSSISFDRDPR